MATKNSQHSSLSLLAALLIGSAACTANVATSGPGGTAGEGGTGANGGSGANGGNGAGGIDAPPLSCASEAGDHSAACASGPCAIESDVEVVCEQREFAALGLAVAVDASRTHLVATSWNYTPLFDVAPDTATRVEDFSLDLDATPVALAVDAEGALVAAGDETTGPSYDGALTLVREQEEGFAREEIFDRADKYIPLHDLAIDPAGRVHVFYASEPPLERSTAVREADGTWTNAVVPTPASSDWHRFALTETGEPLAFGYRENGNNGWQLVAMRDGVEENVGAQSTSFGFGPGRYRPVPNPAVTGPSPTYDYGAVLQSTAGLRFVRVTGTSSEEIAIPDTTPAQYTCDAGFGGPPPCLDTCTEQTSGLEFEAFDVARTSDGDTYVAVVISHIDRVIAYEEQDADGPTCVGNIQSDASTSELRIYRIAADSTAVTAPALTLPLTKYGEESAFTNSADGYRGVALHAYGDALGVAVRLQNWSLEAEVRATARVLRIDTTLLD